RKLSESLLVKDLPRLPRVRGDRGNRKLVEIRAAYLGETSPKACSLGVRPKPGFERAHGSRGDQGTQPFTQTSLLLRHLASPCSSRGPEALADAQGRLPVGRALRAVRGLRPNCSYPARQFPAAD